MGLRGISHCQAEKSKSAGGHQLIKFWWLETGGQRVSPFMEGAGKAAADGAGHGCISCEARAGGRKENLAPALCPEPA